MAPLFFYWTCSNSACRRRFPTARRATTSNRIHCKANVTEGDSCPQSSPKLTSMSVRHQISLALWDTSSLLVVLAYGLVVHSSVSLLGRHLTLYSHYHYRSTVSIGTCLDYLPIVFASWTCLTNTNGNLACGSPLRLNLLATMPFCHGNEKQILTEAALWGWQRFMTKSA